MKSGICISTIKEYNGFFIYEKPVTMSTTEWMSNHLGYDLVMKFEDEQQDIITILAYAEKDVSDSSMKKWFRETCDSNEWSIFIGPMKEEDRIQL